MKKFLLLTLSLFTGLLTISKSYAQCSGGPGACTITATNISSVATKVETIGGNCVTTVNVTLDLGHNGGLKWVPMYFYDGSIPSGVCGTTPSSSSNPLAFILLQYNGGTNFTISSTSVNSIVPQTGYSVTTSAITGGTRINIIGFKITKPGSCTTSNTAVYIGAENASTPGVKCYASSSLTTYQVRISGKVDCTAPRNYDLIVDTDYSPGGVSTPISGNYEVYIDVNSNGLIDDGPSSLVASSTLFGTTVLTPTLNRFTSFDNFYGSSLNGDVLTSKNLLARVIPTTPGIAALTGGLANSCATLPVSMKSFNVKKQTGKVSLTWETADESNNKGFDVQRRLNNGQYETVAFVPAKAINGGGATYSYDDQSLLPDGSIYYRLRQVDNDEQSRYSDIRMIHNNTKKLNVSVYPNPSNGAATLILPEAAGSMDITIEDYTGRTVQRWTSYNSNNLQINQLRPGIYMIRVQSKESGEQTVQRLMVQ
jgi:hypothetical protein